MGFDLFILSVVAALLLFGYWVMDRLDRALGKKPPQKAASDTVDVAIFCTGAEAAPLTDRLSRQGITFRLCPTPAPTENTRFRCALALSDSDMDNLLFCREARRLCGDLQLMARCNDRMYHDIFLESGVCALLPAQWTPETVLRAMEGLKQ